MIYDFNQVCVCNMHKQAKIEFIVVVVGVFVFFKKLL